MTADPESSFYFTPQRGRPRQIHLGRRPRPATNSEINSQLWGMSRQHNVGL